VVCCICNLQSLPLNGVVAELTGSVKSGTDDRLRAEIKAAPDNVKPAIVFRASLAALELCEVLKEQGDKPLRMLDIGGGHGVHADFFASMIPNLEIDIVDMAQNDPRTCFVGDYLDFKADAPYDVIWTSHVLEHVRNPGLFLDRVYEDLADNGIFCCTVPPHRNDRGILEHLTTWDPMLLIINLVRAGFDAQDGRFARYRYNVSGIVRKRTGKFDEPDEVRMPDLPRFLHKYVADFKFWNWSIRKLSQAFGEVRVFESFDVALIAFQTGACEDPFFCIDDETLRNTRYFDGKRSLIMGVN
jgi:SAM-dependent methyltransferase